MREEKEDKNINVQITVRGERLTEALYMMIERHHGLGETMECVLSAR